MPTFEAKKVYTIAVDVGNTSTKIGFFEEGKLQETRRYSSLEEAVTELGAYTELPTIISSVVHTEESLSIFFKEFLSCVFFTQHTPVPIKNSYQSPETLGRDRLAAVVGANARFPEENCLVVDMGTAIKYDLVLAEGDFLGGVISPGRKIRFYALHTFTGKLPLIDSVNIPAVIGTTTESCITSGVLNGIVHEVNGMIEKFNESYNPRVLLCGGDAEYFETQIKYPTFAAPNLVLEGLNRILLYNVAKA